MLIEIAFRALHYLSLAQIVPKSRVCRKWRQLFNEQLNQFEQLETTAEINHYRIEKLIQKCSNLKTVHFRHFLQVADYLNTFKQLAQLREITLERIHCDFNRVFKTKMPFCSKFSFKDSQSDLSSTAVTEWAHTVPNCQYIDFSGTKITNHLLKLMLQKCKRLD